MKTISKSSFIRGTKCPKSLYLHFFQPEERDEISEGQQSIFDTGHSVGTYAQQLFPGGIDASRGQHEKIPEAITYTQELIRNGQKVIYEAAFSDGETLCYMDILVKDRGKWLAYEVKASTSVKDYHVMDAAFQYYVITRSGLPLEEIFLVHLNNQYVRRGVIDVQQLFTTAPMKETILPLQDGIPDELKSLQEMLNAGTAPEVEMGRHCNKPYDCDFIGFCSRPLPQPLANKGGECAIRNQEALDEFKSLLVWPLFFMDFETIMPAIPLHDESRPYQQVPFQYSLHVQKEQGGPVEHFEYLGTPPEDPRPLFIQTLLSRLGNAGSIIVWNQVFETLRLREIARDFPSCADKVESLFERVADLMAPFRKKHFSTPEMNGSYSLKAVLPALMQGLSYGDLEIQEGSSASHTYENLYFDADPESVARKRENLLRYCEMDTMSMVRILDML